MDAHALFKNLLLYLRHALAGGTTHGADPTGIETLSRLKAICPQWA
jgi:hypothetical protein